MKKTKKVFGTREWACKTANCILGCEHNCRYCYAKAMAIRVKRSTQISWPEEQGRIGQINKLCRGRPTRVMFPSAHDITPQNLAICCEALDMLLGFGHEVLIVSKPHLDCVKAMCLELTDYRNRIIFRFTIGSADNETLRFWEPHAPGFEERLAALNHAWAAGFVTSVSCEPMLDGNVDAVVSAAMPFVTDAIWIGKVNQLRARLKINKAAAETLRRGEELISMQSDDRIRALYARLKGNPKIKWKESIKKVVGLEIVQESGFGYLNGRAAIQTIYTIGTEGMHDGEFIEILKAHGIDAVIDIRLRNEGRYYKFASGKHIKALVEANGIAYRHDTRFSPTAEMLERFKAGRDWPSYEQAYRALIVERDMARIWQAVAVGFKRPCLLCAEKTPEKCHRRLLAEHISKECGAPVVHIGGV